MTMPDGVIRQATNEELDQFQNKQHEIVDAVYEVLRKHGISKADLTYFVLIVPGKGSANIFSDIPLDKCKDLMYHLSTRAITQ